MTTFDPAGSTRVMGIVNVTPDSFSDGGRFGTTAEAVDEAERMLAEGADWLDVGGESTRPGAEDVTEEEECRRVLPVITELKRRTAAFISIDTRKSEVARRALTAGADLVNDVSALSDPRMAQVVAEAGVPVILMHMRGTPRTMQRELHYDDLLGEILGFLRERSARAVSAGVSDARILLDPGIGFGKSSDDNLRILRQLPALRAAGHPLVIGASRKSFIGTTLGVPVGERLEGSLAVAAIAAWQGVEVIRAHDVAATKRVVRMVEAIRSA